jgi:folate-binding protein YgfZ
MNLAPNHFSHCFWSPAAWLRLSGEDAPAFLQSQLTNDLSHLMAGGGAVYGLLLTQKGRVLADCHVLRAPEDDAFWVGSYFSLASVIRERFESYIIADDVVVEDVTADWGAVTLFGEAGTATPQPVEGEGVIFAGRRGIGANFEWVFPAAAEAAVRARLAGTRECSAAELERGRIAAGIAAVPADIGPGDLPNEGGLDASAISYRKGCYLGQEVMARLKSMGQLRRRLLRVSGTGAIPPRPAPLFQAGRKAGELRSAVEEGAGFIGLALVTLMNFQAGEGLSFTADGAPVLRVTESR